MDSLQSSMAEAGYRIDGQLGEGGMGTVYRATQLSLERVVALKVLTVELSSDAGFRERFRREGLQQAALDHPHIVTVYEAGETENRLFLAMRMVEGPTLKELIQRRELDDRRALRLLTQVAEALDAAHERGLIHRDVKPQNVLVGAGDHAYLADFGLTKAHDDAGMTETGQFVGTIDYISPEQARGDHATARSDAYALTAVLYECLTGEVPFVRATEERALLAHLSEPPPRSSEVRSDLPAAMDDVIAAGMAKDPAERPASAGDLMLEARRALSSMGQAPGAPAPADAAGLDLGVGMPTRAAHPIPPSDAGATRLAGAAAATAPAAAAAGVTAPAGQMTGAAHTVGAGTVGSGAAPPAMAAGTPASSDAGSGRFIAAVAGAAIVAVIAGFLLGGGSSGSGESFSNSASVGNVELSFPAGWQRIASAPAIPGLALSQPLALAATGGSSSQRLVAGEAKASGPSLLPGSFAGALSGPLPHAEAVRLGSIEAYRYHGLSVHGLPGPVTLYAIPTANGVATVACLSASTAAAGAVSKCEQIAATLKLSGTTAFSLAPSTQYAAALAHIFDKLQSAVSAGSARLHSASSASAQATAASQLAAAYAAASVAVTRLPVSPAVQSLNASIARSLAAVGHDYAALASAARAGDEAAYARAGRAIAADRARATAALAALRQAGYVVSG
jgi:Protein kinase domain